MLLICNLCPLIYCLFVVWFNIPGFDTGAVTWRLHGGYISVF